MYEWVLNLNFRKTNYDSVKFTVNIMCTRQHIQNNLQQLSAVADELHGSKS
jgi:hypothetical protein